MKAVFAALSLLLVVACEPATEGEPVTRARIDGKSGPAAGASPADDNATGTTAVESACRSVIFENTSLTHCLATPSRHRINMVLGAGSDAPYRSLPAFARTRNAASVAFAMNGGMFDKSGQPIGYYVETAERLVPLKTASGEGNFHMLPNGVFFGSDELWEVRTTEDFLANVSDRPQFGTQSGPMLLIDGKLHPDISHDGESRVIRNGVGVDERGRAHFVISNAPISFGKLARFYRDELSVRNALYLDGSVSSLWNPTTDRLDSGAPIGPIIVVEKKSTAP